MKNRQNILEIVASDKQEYHSVIFTCYTFDPIFFNNYCLPILNGRGIRNIVILQDASRYDELLSDFELVKALQPLSYTLVRQEPSKSGVFHPKVSLYIGKDNGILMLGSGNLTYSGMSKNEEIWGVLKYTSSYPQYASVLYKVWKYLYSFSSNWTETTKSQIKNIINNSWLKDYVETDEDYVTLENGNKLQFVANDQEGSIYTKIKNVLQNTEIKSVKIISPFYDKEGVLIQSIMNDFTPKEVKCIISKNGTYPWSLMNNNESAIKFFKWDKVIQDNSSNKNLHAKIVQFENSNGTYFVYGSANAGDSAFGCSGDYQNDEACFLLYGENKNFLNELNVDFSDNAIYTQSDIKDYPQKNIVNSTTPNNILIISSEYQSNIVSVHTNKSMRGYNVVIKDDEMRIIESISIDIDTKLLTYKYEAQKNPYIVTLENDKGQVSNNSLVHIYKIVYKSDPNKRNSEFRDLISKPFNDDSLLQLINYIEFDDNWFSKEKTKSLTVRKQINSVTSDAVDIEVKELNDYDNEDEVQHEKHNYQVFNALCNVLFHSQNENSKTKISYNRVNDSDDGNTSDSKDGDIENQDIEVDIDAESLRKVRNLSHKYSKFLDCIFEHFDATLKNGSSNLLYGYRKEGTYRANNCVEPFAQMPITNNYIAMGLTVGYLCDTLKNVEYNTDVCDIKEECKGLFVTNYGRFLLLHYDGYIDKVNDAEILKFRTIHQTIALSALIFICMNKWEKDINTLILLFLNTFDSFRKNIVDLDDVLNRLDDELSKYNNVNGEVVKLLRVVHKEYRQWHTSKESGNLKATEIKVSWKSQFIYKTGYGFLYAEKLSSSIKAPFKFYVSHPGFSGIAFKTEFPVSKLLIIKDSNWL